MYKCNCELCKVNRGIERLERKYRLTKRDLAPIECLWNMAAEYNTRWSMLKLKLCDAPHRAMQSAKGARR